LLARMKATLSYQPRGSCAPPVVAWPEIIVGVDRLRDHDRHVIAHFEKDAPGRELFNRRPEAKSITVASIWAVRQSATAHCPGEGH